MYKKILIIGVLILLAQIIYFSDYIMPFHWGHLKVRCPDETVVNGQLYLRNITPDSLKQYDLDYSEIYVTERPSTKIDPMGADLYIIKGKVIGKDRVYKGDHWNLKFKVDEWREVNILIDWGVKMLLFIELLVLLMLVSYLKSKNGVQQDVKRNAFNR